MTPEVNMARIENAHQPAREGCGPDGSGVAWSDGRGGLSQDRPGHRIQRSVKCVRAPVAVRRVTTEMYMGQLKRIASDPTIFGGKPIVRGMRISVERVLSLLAQGETQEAILADYTGLESEDIRACLAYAHAVLANERLDDVVVTLA